MLRSSRRCNDPLLLKRAVNDKDRTALGVLYAEYYPRLKRYIARRIDSAVEAEDLAQNVFVQLWETRAHYEMKKPMEAYLFTVAGNVIAQYVRQKRKRVPCVPIDALAENFTDHGSQQYQESKGQVLWPQLQEIMGDMAARLSPKAYEAIRLRFIEGLSVREAARTAGCSVEAFYSRLERGLKTLKRATVEEGKGGALLG